MFLPIVVYGHPILRKTSVDITMDYPELEKLIQDMFYTMDEADGVGLAAPQIGRNIRVFTVDGSPFAEMDPDCNGFRKVFINAHISERWGEEISRVEGCLSVPGINDEVTRFDHIKMSYLNEKGEAIKDEEFSGVKAWIIQQIGRASCRERV